MITLYTTNCPKCEILESKLNDKGILYEKCEDIKIMKKKGFMAAPMLEVEGRIMNYLDATVWIKEQ